MKIGIILTRPSPNFVAAAELLRGRGVGVDLLFANERTQTVTRPTVQHDLYFIKSGRGSALALAGILHAAGAPTHWPFPLAAAHKNKLLVAAQLTAAGVPVPPTTMAPDAAALVPLLADGPLMIKPYLGSRGEGIVLVRDAASLGALAPAPPDEPLMAQCYLEPDPGGSYLVAYRIGDETFGLVRRWPIDDPRDSGVACELSPRLEELTIACGDCYDTDLYSVDFVISGGKPFVVDMSLHAGFAGVPDAAARLADYLGRLVGR